MNKWSAYFIYHAYQLCIQTLFQFISNFCHFLNLAGGGGEDEKQLVGLQQAAPQAKTASEMKYDLIFEISDMNYTDDLSFKALT